MDDPAVGVGPDGSRTVVVTVAADPGDRTRVWLATLSADGVPSAVAGPYTVFAPPSPLPVPDLAVITGAPSPAFTWGWPSGSEPAARLLVALERSGDGAAWERVSAMLEPATTAVSVDQPQGAWQYRLRVTSPDGRTAHGAPVTV